MSVRTHHPLYDKRYPQWALMRDVMEGADRIKEQGEKYLPRPSVSHEKFDIYEQMSYEAFKERAIWTGYTAQIHDCLHGMGEAKPAKLEIPKKLRASGILNNIDYRGTTFNQFQSDVLSDVLITSFGGILVDIPKVNPNMSVLMAEKSNIRPYITYYRAESVINYKYIEYNGVNVLYLVVLEEEVDSTEDIFEHKMEKQWRVIYLNEKKECMQCVFRITKSKTGEDVEELISKPTPILINGQNINYIPFITLPFNEPTKPILYDIALNNISHFQTSADYMNGTHLTSRPTLCFTGHRPEVDRNGEPIPVYIGTDVVWQLPEKDAKAFVVSFSGEGISHLEKCLDRIEGHIITLASHIISAEKKTAENKDAISIHRQGEDAKLATLLRYFSEKMTNALKIIAQWIGCSQEEIDDIIFELPSDFDSISFDANAVNSIANIFSQGKLPLRCLYNLLKKGNYLESDMTYEGFVYLLDLEASSLNPQEVDEAYKKYQRSGERLKLNTGDWFSPDSLYKEKEA